MQARLPFSTLVVLGVWVLLNLGSAANAFGPAASSEAILRSVFTYDKVEALNFNLVQQVPLCAATGTRVQPSVMAGSNQLCSTAGPAKPLGESALRNVLALLNDPTNFQPGPTSTAPFEPHLAVLFRDAQRQVVLVVEISLLSNTIRTQPRLADFTMQALSAKGKGVVAGLCEGLGLTLVDNNYAQQYTPERLNASQRAALLAFAINPSQFSDLAMAQNTAEQRAAEQRAAEQRAAEQRAAEQRAASNNQAMNSTANNAQATVADDDSDDDVSLDAFDMDDAVAEPVAEVGRRDARELEREERASLDAALNLDDDLGGDIGLNELDEVGAFEEDDFGDFDMDMDF